VQAGLLHVHVCLPKLKHHSVNSVNLQIEVQEISTDPCVAGNLADTQHFMFQVFRVVKKFSPEESEDPDVRLAKVLLSRSRNAGPQEELWIANSIAQLKAQGQLESLSQGQQVKGVQRFREIAEHVGHVAQVVAQLNKLKLRLNTGVSLPSFIEYYDLVVSMAVVRIKWFAWHQCKPSMMHQRCKPSMHTRWFASRMHFCMHSDMDSTRKCCHSLCRVKKLISWSQSETTLSSCRCMTGA
jgi:hypothetical protein